MCSGSSELEDQGNAPTIAVVKEMGSFISVESGGSGRVGEHWIYSFFTRHPEVKTKVGKKLDHERVEASNVTKIRSWFRMLRDGFRQFRPTKTNTWNFDETGSILAAACNSKVVGSSETSEVIVRKPENREWVSILECISAEGKCYK